MLVHPVLRPRRPVPGYIRAKPDKPPVGKDGKPSGKYLSPTKATVRAYFPPGAGPAITDATRPLAFTEGEKKSLSIWEAGTPVVGLAGVDCWSKPRARGPDGKAQGRRDLLDDFALILLAGRVVYLIFDSDIATNRNVLQAEGRLARTLTERGAVVFLVRIPHPTDGKKLGIDDYLGKQPDRAAALASLFPGAINFRDSIRRTEAGPYRVQDGRIIRETPTQAGPVETALCNFEARIAEEVVRDDGTDEVRIDYAIEGELAKRPLPRAVVRRPLGRGPGPVRRPRRGR